MELKDVKLQLVDLNKEVCLAFEKHFGIYEVANVWNIPFQELNEFDLMVSPANSFGQMDGGIDQHITDYFGKQLMDRVQDYIVTHYAGEQPVGTSFIIDTMNSKHPYLAHTPTMRTPRNIVGTDNPYRAMKAMLLAVEHHNRDNPNKISSIACSGLGTFIGRIPPEVAVKQMALAYHHVLNPLKKIDWITAMERTREIERTIQ